MRLSVSYLPGILVTVLALAAPGSTPAQPSRPVQSVAVVNEPTVHAVPVPFKEPFHRQFFIEIPSGTLTGSETFSVPAGKRLVIEWVGGSTRVSAQELVRLRISTTAAGEFATHDIAPSVYRRDFEGSDPPINPDFVVGFSQPVKFYADPGSGVSVIVSRTENLELTATGFAVSLSGFLVDCGGNPACPIP